MRTPSRVAEAGQLDERRVANGQRRSMVVERGDADSAPAGHAPSAQPATAGSKIEMTSPASTGRLRPIQVAHVLVVDVEVDEAPLLAVRSPAAGPASAEVALVDVVRSARAGSRRRQFDHFACRPPSVAQHRPGTRTLAISAVSPAPSQAHRRTPRSRSARGSSGCRHTAGKRDHAGSSPRGTPCSSYRIATVG